MGAISCAHPFRARALELTASFRYRFSVNFERHDVILLRVGQVTAVLSLDDLHGAVLDEFGPARNIHRQDHDCLFFWCRQVISYRVEIDERLVE